MEKSRSREAGALVGSVGLAERPADVLNIPLLVSLSIGG